MLPLASPHKLLFDEDINYSRIPLAHLSPHELIIDGDYASNYVDKISKSPTFKRSVTTIVCDWIPGYELLFSSLSALRHLTLYCGEGSCSQHRKLSSSCAAHIETLRFQNLLNEYFFFPNDYG